MVAFVSLFPITVFPGFGITIIPVSNPNVLALLGTLLFTGVAFNCVTVELKKLLAGRSTADMVTPFNFNLSF